MLLFLLLLLQLLLLLLVLLLVIVVVVIVVLLLQLLLTSLKVNRERLQPHHPYRIQEGENSYLVMERVGNI